MAEVVQVVQVVGVQGQHAKGRFRLGGGGAGAVAAGRAGGALQAARCGGAQQPRDSGAARDTPISCGRRCAGGARGSRRRRRRREAQRVAGPTVAARGRLGVGGGIWAGTLSMQMALARRPGRPGGVAQ